MTDTKQDSTVAWLDQHAATFPYLWGGGSGNPIGWLEAPSRRLRVRYSRSRSRGVDLTRPFELLAGVFLHLEISSFTISDVLDRVQPRM